MVYIPSVSFPEVIYLMMQHTASVSLQVCVWVAMMMMMMMRDNVFNIHDSINKPV